MSPSERKSKTESAQRALAAALTPESVAQCCPQLVDALDPRLFQALGDENRLMLLCRLAVADQAQTVSQLAECCGVHISGVSRHLAQLRDADVIVAHKVGREVRYELRRDLLIRTLRAIADGLEGATPTQTPAPTSATAQTPTSTAGEKPPKS